MKRKMTQCSKTIRGTWWSNWKSWPSDGNVPSCLVRGLEKEDYHTDREAGGEEVLILVDTGSSYSYISSELVIGLDIKYQMVSNPFSIIMENGVCVTNNAICPSVMWEVNQYKFKFDLKVMELGGWDIILGVDWMVHFSPITFDFHQLKISLFNQG